MESVQLLADQHSVQKEIQNTLAPDGGLCTAYLVIAEFMCPDGNKVLRSFAGEYVTEWLRTGMLLEAINDDSWEQSDDPDGG